MDISGFIGELLYDHDCVIIPGFGGFVCSYQAATINEDENTIHPPCKAVSFNRYLQSNDGLLINYIAERNGISFYGANEVVNTWVNFSNAQLAKNEEIVLQNVGRFFNDEEGNLQFELNDSINYLKSSYGLRIIQAAPVVRIKEITQNKPADVVPLSNRSAILRIAASVLIITCIAAFAEMMWMDVQIKGLKLDESNVAGFIDRIFHTEEHTLKPIPIQIQEQVAEKKDTTITVTIKPSVSTVTQPPVIKEDPVTTKQVTPAPAPAPAPVAKADNGNLHSYYIIIGAFKDDQNAENAKNKLLQRYSRENILYEKHATLTKVGYYAGASASEAQEQLNAAHTQDATYWLMKK